MERSWSRCLSNTQRTSKRSRLPNKKYHLRQPQETNVSTLKTLKEEIWWSTHSRTFLRELRQKMKRCIYDRLWLTFAPAMLRGTGNILSRQVYSEVRCTVWYSILHEFGWNKAFWKYYESMKPENQ